MTSGSFTYTVDNNCVIKHLCEILLTSNTIEHKNKNNTPKNITYLTRVSYYNIIYFKKKNNII